MSLGSPFLLDGTVPHASVPRLSRSLNNGTDV